VSANAPARIAADLTRAILRGEHPPGTHLPPLRDLAADHGVNPSTMQRVLARLESRGLVTARQGSGFTVCDPRQVGDLSLAVEWLDALADRPDEAAALLANVLEVRRVLAARLIARHRLAVLDALAALAVGAEALADPAADRDRVVAADLDTSRRVIAATGNAAALAVLNTLARALAELPVLVEAMYGRPERNAAAMVDVLGAIRDGGPEVAERIEATFEAVDAETVARFRRLLAGSPSPAR
jgi:DNA-binding FadR family transcriptional regulator